MRAEMLAYSVCIGMGAWVAMGGGREGLPHDAATALGGAAPHLGARLPSKETVQAAADAGGGETLMGSIYTRLGAWLTGDGGGGGGGGGWESLLHDPSLPAGAAATDLGPQPPSIGTTLCGGASHPQASWLAAGDAEPEFGAQLPSGGMPPEAFGAGGWEALVDSICGGGESLPQDPTTPVGAAGTPDLTLQLPVNGTLQVAVAAAGAGESLPEGVPLAVSDAMQDLGGQRPPGGTLPEAFAVDGTDWLTGSIYRSLRLWATGYSEESLPQGPSPPVGAAESNLAVQILLNGKLQAAVADASDRESRPEGVPLAASDAESDPGAHLSSSGTLPDAFAVDGSDRVMDLIHRRMVLFAALCWTILHLRLDEKGHVRLEKHRCEQEGDRVEEERVAEERVRQGGAEEERLGEERVEEKRVGEIVVEEEGVGSEQVEKERVGSERVEEERNGSERIEEERFEKTPMGDRRSPDAALPINSPVGLLASISQAVLGSTLAPSFVGDQTCLLLRPACRGGRNAGAGRGIGAVGALVACFVDDAAVAAKGCVQVQLVVERLRR
jgi:hypothetical protein